MEEKLTFPLRVYPLRSFTVVSALRFMKVTRRTMIFLHHMRAHAQRKILLHHKQQKLTLMILKTKMANHSRSVLTSPLTPDLIN